MAERNSICKKDYDVAEQAATFTFANGNIVRVALTEIQGVLTQLALHGLVQKVGDSFAGEKDPDEAQAKASDVINRLRAGDFNKARESAGPSSTITVQAVARLRNMALEDAQLKWEELDDDAKKSVRADPRVKAEVARIKAERAEAKAAKEAASGTPAGDALDAFAA